MFREHSLHCRAQMLHRCIGTCENDPEDHGVGSRAPELEKIIYWQDLFDIFIPGEAQGIQLSLSLQPNLVECSLLTTGVLRVRTRTQLHSLVARFLAVGRVWPLA